MRFNPFILDFITWEIETQFDEQATQLACSESLAEHQSRRLVPTTFLQLFEEQAIVHHLKHPARDQRSEACDSEDTGISSSAPSSGLTTVDSDDDLHAGISCSHCGRRYESEAKLK